MHVLSASGLGKSYDERVLFQDVSFGVSTDDHIGVVGSNGAGKSTLLRILAGDLEADSGDVILKGGVRIEWLPQEPQPDPALLAIEVARGGQEGVVLEHEAASMLDALNVEADKPVGELSGGQRRRVALANALLSPSDLLILDEPTNHLDVDTIDWLEERLKRRAGGLLMVTHDRYFLERLTNQMLEVDGGAVHRHEGTYADMLEARSERQSVEHKQDAQRQNLLRKEIAWLRRQPKARGSKPKFREDAARDLMAVDGPAETRSLQLGTGRRRLGNDVIDLIGVDAGYDGVSIVHGVDLAVGPGARIGLAGPNGAGKTTLLRTMLGQLPAVAGEVRHGKTIELGIYEQNATVLQDDTSVLATILEIGTHVPLANGEKLTASKLCERFGFDDKLQFTPVRRLSGGERRRLALLHILIQAPNVLVLDEPTNDLDLDTLAALEDHLDGFKGTLIVASHDRFVLDRLTDVLYAIDDGKMRQYLDWSHYRETAAAAAAGAVARAANQAQAQPAATKTSTLDNRRRQELAKEVRSVEGRMTKVTKLRDALNDKLIAASSNPGRLMELDAERRGHQSEIDDLEERWLEVSDELES
ncbi:MAG: ATP-binding cassette subfamily F protein uup [Glaciecola sp.]|jgi:ATP-binding cassette subfamily F protein uup